jgi:putative flippase GtrA
MNQLPRLLRYLLVGGGTLLLYWALCAVLMTGAGLQPAWATAISVVVSGIANYVGHAFITFGGRREFVRSAGRYLVLVTGNAVLAGGVVGVLHAMTANLFLANVIALVLITLTSYVIMARWVMRSQ